MYCTTSGTISRLLSGGNVRRSFIGLRIKRSENVRVSGRRELCGAIGHLRQRSEPMTHDLLTSSSALIPHSWATTHSTLSPTPHARRKSHSSRTSRSGGVAAQKVRMEGKA